MVTEAQVWEALSEVADPEIPVVSLVDLGVVRDVRVEHDRVHVGFTPTFLGCPALEVMRDELAAKVIELGAEPDIEVIRDDSWSTDRITPEGREKLRAAGFAPPAPRSTGETTLLQLQTGTFRCPYCGSTDTQAREHLRADALPLDPLLQRLPPALRAVQDDLARKFLSMQFFQGHFLFIECSALTQVPAQPRDMRGFVHPPKLDAMVPSDLVFLASNFFRVARASAQRAAACHRRRRGTRRPPQLACWRTGLSSPSITLRFEQFGRKKVAEPGPC